MNHIVPGFHNIIWGLRQRIAPLYYEIVYWLLTPSNINTMNYGYAPVSEDLRRHHPDPSQGFQYELYWQTLKQLDISLASDQVHCEISCGRGGGLAFLRNLTEAEFIGLETSWAARRYAKKYFNIATQPATAPILPLKSASIDVFISIEAAHNYHNDTFVAEIKRNKC